MITDKYQGLCLVNEEGWQNMHFYDDLHPSLRHRLAYSPFNLCPACVATFADRWVPSGMPRVLVSLNAIKEMENYIRDGRE